MTGSGLNPLSPTTTLSNLLQLFKSAQASILPPSQPTSSPNLHDSLKSLIEHLVPLTRLSESTAPVPDPDLSDCVRNRLNDFYWDPDLDDNALARPALRCAQLINDLATEIIKSCLVDVHGPGESLGGGSAVELGERAEWRAGRRNWQNGKEEVGHAWEHVRSELWEGISVGRISILGHV